jgi:hypothetical protein
MQNARHDVHLSNQREIPEAIETFVADLELVSAH